jgi:hypothetical protein
MTNYASMRARIARADSLADTAKLERSLDRLYNAGVFTPNELGRLDSLIMDRNVQIKEF